MRGERREWQVTVKMRLTCLRSSNEVGSVNRFQSLSAMGGKRTFNRRVSVQSASAKRPKALMMAFALGRRWEKESGFDRSGSASGRRGEGLVGLELVEADEIEADDEDEDRCRKVGR